MVLIDFHAHLDFKDFDKDRDELVKKMQEKNIMAVSNTLNLKNYLYTKQLFKNYKNIKVTPGLYPQDAEKISDEDFKNYIQIIEKDKDEIIAIGEVGLDKHHTTDEELFQIQIKRFKQLIDLAIKIDKPLIVHTRKAESIILDIIEETIKTKNFKKFNLHCFCGKKKLIKKIRELNIYCSIPLTILNTQSFEILVEGLKINQLLVETDSPFLNPDKVRNSPLNIVKIYEKIAKIKGYDKKEIENIIYNNFMRLTL